MLLPIALFWLIVAPPLIAVASLGGSRGRYRMVLWLTSPFCRSVAWGMGVRLRIVGERDPEALVFVGNHVSWLDILTAGWGIGGVFVSRHDVADWPLIGIFARLAGTVFIDRASLRSAIESSREIVERTSQGIPVVFFPEGETNDGSEVGQFRPFLFAAIAEQGVRVQPFTIRYTHAGGRPITPDNRDLVYWYDPEQSFVTHALTLMRNRPVEAELHFRTAESPPTTIDRKELNQFVETLHQRVSEGIPVWKRSNS